MVKADGMVQPTIFYRAASVDKKAGNLYGLLKARITSCAQPVPRWRFSASRANFRKDDYVEMWNAVFRIKKVPVFYLPYMRYPVGRDRATGFLIPRSAGRAKGFNFEQGFYWAIARNMDATFNLDYYAARGVGGGLGFRYLFSGGTGGEANLYGFTFKRDACGAKQDDAYIVRLNHNQPLPFGFNLVANVDLQSSYDFLREFDNNFRRAIVSNRSSQVYLQRSWSYFNLSARVSRFEPFSARRARPVDHQQEPAPDQLQHVQGQALRPALPVVRLVLQPAGIRLEEGIQKGDAAEDGGPGLQPDPVGAVHADPLADDEHVGHGELRLLPAELRAGDDEGATSRCSPRARRHGRGRRAGVLEGLPEQPRRPRLQAHHRALHELPVRQPHPGRSGSSRRTPTSSGTTSSSTGSRTGSMSRSQRPAAGNRPAGAGRDLLPRPRDGAAEPVLVDGKPPRSRRSRGPCGATRRRSTAWTCRPATTRITEAFEPEAERELGSRSRGSCR